MKIALIIISCYLLGSIPFGYIVGKLFKKVDIREYGSGNIGASNALRILGPSLASFVVIGDIGKGIFSIYLAQHFNIDNLLILTITGLAVICGHDWSLFLGFKGGKGIATTIGVVFAFNPIIALLAVTVWVIVIIITRYTSLSSIFALISIFVFTILFKQPYEYIVFGAIILVLGIFKHKENIERLKSKKERKIGEKIKIEK
ncbi:acyl-phosphate glycerol 3-phosphate acyltransferase [Candidatus Atribacteria bacterium RBG_19FT_COMBO_35_14]|uniref:Glycerol-3-phosphate acyltransferase n=1 Tax=Candidatus Sediminicultor quintus TaxID=1797291 RepID=A0A1F5A6M7_9BACT|nr:MAG: acyl-phosphate glycerol 3-phosphate acyltransferase [Candidatus Atribacteria bacterium RBG_19FT_COMBO_35_14]OGD31683.1 MAG: acyl-phosphate glycerol 3-phosphate acyltransferase [Candidatus Atribacteria bacterium RBG_16_35_8]